MTSSRSGGMCTVCPSPRSLSDKWSKRPGHDGSRRETQETDKKRPGEGLSVFCNSKAMAALPDGADEEAHAAQKGLHSVLGA